MRRQRKVRTVCERQHRSIRIWAFSLAAFILLVLLTTCDAQADTINDNLATALMEDSSVPLSMSVADTLAANLLTAQADSSYAASEPDSLTLSFAAVLRAISLDPSLTLAYLQSEIAIDDRVSIAFSVDGVPLLPGQVLDFGSVAVGDSSGAFVVTPEPNTFLLAICGLVGIGFAMHLRVKRW